MAETNNIVVVLKLKINKLREKKACNRTSLVVQWLGIYLPMWGTLARSQDQEDCTCLRALKPVGHKLMFLERVLHNKRSHCKGKTLHHSKEQPPFPQLEEACAQ